VVILDPLGLVTPWCSSPWLGGSGLVALAWLLLGWGCGLAVVPVWLWLRLYPGSAALSWQHHCGSSPIGGSDLSLAWWIQIVGSDLVVTSWICP